jgi:AcrR family transcriptional regulator
MPKREPPPRTRVRRAPQEARQLILDAARELVRERLPDAIGLKDVAERAGVSHALVTHYFGGIDRLVDAALEAHAEANRAELVALMMEGAEGGPKAWLAHLFSWVMRPESPRLLAWSFLSGKIARSDFFSRRTRGMQKVADLLEERFRGELAIDREDVEFALLLVMSATFGYAIGRAGFWGGLGVDKPGEKEDTMFRDRLGDLVETLMRERARAR